MILAVTLDPLYLIVLVPAFILAFAMFVGRFLAAGGSGDDRDDGDVIAVLIADDGPVRFYARDTYLVEALTRTPGESHAHASSRPRRHDGDCRPRSVHPAI